MPTTRCLPTGMITGPPGGEDLTFERRFNRADVDAVSIVVICGPLGPAPPPDSCRATHPMPFQVHGLELTLREDVLPTVSLPEGTLLEGGPQSGTRTVTYAASDLQAGLAKVEVLLGDNVVASHDLRPRCAYADFTVCPPSDDDTLAVDTRAVPNGSYDFALRVVDAAGNERVRLANAPLTWPIQRPRRRFLPFRTRSSPDSRARHGRRSP